MDLLQSFVFNKSEHKVKIIQKDADTPLFRAIDIGNVLGIKNIRTSIKDFDSDEKVSIRDYSPGGDQETTFLTEEGVYKTIMCSRKPIAKLFQKWVFKAIKEIRLTGKYEMQSKIDDMQKKCDTEVRECKDHVDQIAHNSVVKGSDKHDVVYYGKIKTLEDGTSLIKIGSTSDIKQRAVGLNYEFGSMWILNTFECEDHTHFEKFLHQHSDISKYKHIGMINELKYSNEVFRFTPSQYEKAVNIGLRNVSRYRRSKKRDIDEMIDSNETVQKLCEKLGIGATVCGNPENPPYESKKGHTTHNGRKVQKYDTDKNLVETYDRIMDAMRVKQHSSYSMSGISRACEDKSVYRGFRWAYLDKNLDSDMVQDIGDTVMHHPIRSGHVATLNSERTEVHSVYRHFKELGLEQGFTGSDAVIKRMKRGASLDDGRYIISWNDVHENIQNVWLEKNTLPVIQPNHVSIKVNRVHPDTGEVLETYATIGDVKIKFGMNGRTLRSVIAGSRTYRNFKWEYGKI